MGGVDINRLLYLHILIVFPKGLTYGLCSAFWLAVSGWKSRYAHEQRTGNHASEPSGRMPWVNRPIQSIPRSHAPRPGMVSHTLEVQLQNLTCSITQPRLEILLLRHRGFWVSPWTLTYQLEMPEESWL